MSIADGLDFKIQNLAVRCLQEDVSYQEYTSGEIPRDMGLDFALAVQEIEKQLNEDDYSKLAGYAPIFTREGGLVNKTSAADILLWLKIEAAQKDIFFEAYLSGKYKGSKIDEIAPELIREMDDDGLIPVALLDPLPDAFR